MGSEVRGKPPPAPPGSRRHQQEESTKQTHPTKLLPHQLPAPQQHTCRDGARGRLVPIIKSDENNQDLHFARCTACGALALHGDEARHYGDLMRRPLLDALKMLALDHKLLAS